MKRNISDVFFGVGKNMTHINIRNLHFREIQITLLRQVYACMLCMYDITRLLHERLVSRKIRDSQTNRLSP